MAKIGFLGLGAMGLPMAKRLLAAGHAVKVAVHSNPAPARELESLGATVAADMASVVRDVDIVISILPEDKQIEEVMFSPAVAEAVPSDAIVVEMSTATSETVRRLSQLYAKRGIPVLDAPVSGGVDGAANGTLTIMCGGDAAVLERVRPVLEAMGKKIILVGDVGSGKDVKAVNNLLAAVNMVMVTEALQLAKKLNLDLDVAYEVIKTSSGQSFYFDARFKRVVEENFEAGFKMWLMIKDMRIALKEADDLTMPLSQLAFELYKMTDEKDKDLDFSAVARVFPGLRKN